MSNVYYVGSEPLSFEGIERILTQNMKLELSRGEGAHPALPGLLGS